MREADNLTTFMCRMSWKSGSLNLLEHSGPHRACYGALLPLLLLLLLLIAVSKFLLLDVVREFDQLDALGKCVKCG